MGFKPPKKIFKLEFETAELSGLEVKAKSVSVGRLMDIVKMAGRFMGRDKKDFKPEDLEAIEGLFEAFADVLVEWNLEDDDDEPVPTTKEGLYSQDFNMVIEIILAWMDAVAGVSDPLDKNSSGGEPSLAGSIPMETL